MLSANQLLQNRYRIQQHLGHGGMGAVYTAIDETFGEPIALKEITIESADEHQKNLILKAFEREAKSLAKARHETIPFVRDYFSENGRQFLVMELIEGSDLSELLANRSTPFAVSECLKWLDQLLDALDYLHNLNPPIIHRDIKPQNLKLNSRGKIKLLDFGIAKSTDADSTITNQTFVGATMDYSPIEQILRVIDPTFREFILLKYKAEAEKVLSQTTDARCDIYSLGATFYHLLTKQPPVDSTKRTLEIWSGNADPLENISELNPTVPPAVSECLLKAMHVERSSRFASALEMQKALQAAIGEEKNFSPVGENLTGNQTYNVIKTKKAVAAATQPSLAETALPDLNVAVHNDSSVSIPTYYPADIPSKPDKKSWMLPIAAIGILAVGAVGGTFWITRPNSVGADKPLPNKVVSNSAALPTVVPSVIPSALPETAANTSKAQTPDKKPEFSKPASVSPDNKPPVSTGAKKPERKTLPKQPTQNADCVFTNSCK